MANTLFPGAYLEIVLPPEIPLSTSSKGNIIVTGQANLDAVTTKG
jgi:hypothetical protein